MTDILKDNIVNYFKSNKDNQIEKIAAHFNVKSPFVSKVIDDYFKKIRLSKPNQFI